MRNERKADETVPEERDDDIPSSGVGPTTTEVPLRSVVSDDERLRSLYRCVYDRLGRWPNLYAALANAPDLLAAWVDFAWTLRASPDVARTLRELAILRVAQLTNKEYEWARHVFMARSAGVSEEEIANLRDWRGAQVFSGEQRLVLSVAENLTKTGELSDEQRAGLLAHFGPRQTVELVLTTAFYSCVSRVLGGLKVPLDEHEGAIPGFSGE